MKKSIAIFAALAAFAACADIHRNGPPRDIRSPGMKIRITENDRHGYDIEEDAPIFYTKFASLNYPEYLLNYAEHKQLAVEVARTVADYFGSTNVMRIAHWEQPHVANTNDFAEALSAMLKGKFVTGEIVPLRPEKGGQK